MGCSASTPAVMEAPKEQQRISLSAASRKTANSGNDGKNEQQVDDDNKSYPASEAFVIPLDDDAATKTYRPGTATTPMAGKKPPKRIQELMQQAEKAEPTVNLEELEKKLNEAELRRKEYLQQKIENIQKTTQTLMRSSVAATAPELEEQKENEKESEEGNKLKDSATYANEIKAKALDDDSKHELLSSTWKR